MIKYFKKRLIEFLSNYFEKIKNESDLRFIQYGIDAGQNSTIKTPKTIEGSENIIVGENTVIGHSAWISAYDSYFGQKFSPKINIGNDVSIGNYSCITAIDEISIGDGCLFSEYVYISDHYHDANPNSGIPPKYQPILSKNKVVIGENTFVGFRVSILSGVTIGRNCIVGAHSVVTKSIPDFTMVAGIPAKIIKIFDFEKNSWESL